MHCLVSGRHANCTRVCRKRVTADSSDDKKTFATSHGPSCLQDRHTAGRLSQPPAALDKCLSASPDAAEAVSASPASGNAPSTQNTSPASQADMQSEAQGMRSADSAAFEDRSAEACGSDATDATGSTAPSRSAAQTAHGVAASLYPVPADGLTAALELDTAVAASTVANLSSAADSVGTKAQSVPSEEVVPVTGEAGSGPAKAPVPVLLLLSGVPGSGKSSFCKKLIAQSKVAWVRVNQDSINGGKGTPVGLKSKKGPLPMIPSAGNSCR